MNPQNKYKKWIYGVSIVLGVLVSSIFLNKVAMMSDHFIERENETLSNKVETICGNYVFYRIGSFWDVGEKCQEKVNAENTKNISIGLGILVLFAVLGYVVNKIVLKENNFILNFFKNNSNKKQYLFLGSAVLIIANFFIPVISARFYGLSKTFNIYEIYKWQSLVIIGLYALIVVLYFIKQKKYSYILAMVVSGIGLLRLFIGFPMANTMAKYSGMGSMYSLMEKKIIHLEFGYYTYLVLLVISLVTTIILYKKEFSGKVIGVEEKDVNTQPPQPPIPPVSNQI